jgi:large subunit ribosomal protein L7e
MRHNFRIQENFDMPGPKTYDPSAPPLVEETLLKKRRSLDELAYWRSVNLTQQVSKKRVIRGEDVRIKRPEQFVREYRIKEGSLNKMKRRRRETERRVHVDVPRGQLQGTVGVAVRIHEGRHSSSEIKEALRKLGLTKKYDAIFVHLDEEGIRKLKPLDAYVAYGYVTYKMVDELIHRRAYTDVGGAIRPLKDNLVVEKVLGEYGILCLNDLADEIYRVGERFHLALGVLRTFKLAAPVGHYEKKVLNMHDGVEDKGGFLGEKMTEFLEKIV